LLPQIEVESILKLGWTFSYPKIATKGAHFGVLENSKPTKNLVAESWNRQKRIKEPIKKR
jgi:hypothetical protein